MAITTLLEDERVLNPDGSDAHRIVLLVNQDVGDSVELTGAQIPGLNNDDVIAAGSTLITPSANYVAFVDGVFSKKSGGSAGGGGGSALPAVTSADNGKVLSVVDGAWAADDNRFVVNCTPTAEDFSGTMDKTVGEIREAWLARKSIYFYTDETGYFPLGVASDYFMAYGIHTSQNIIVVVYTDDISDSHAYHTKIYQLTLPD